MVQCALRYAETISTGWVSGVVKGACISLLVYLLLPCIVPTPLQVLCLRVFGASAFSLWGVGILGRDC